jgi:O-antigen/teichoic acid export membrane protein
MTISSTVFWSVNTLMLAQLTGVDQVGIYNAASRLSEVLKNLFCSYAIVLLPAMSAAFADSVESLQRQSEAALRYMVIGALPVATGVTVLAPDFIRLIYGVRFAAASPVLVVLVWTVAVFSIALVFARILVAGHRQTIDLYCNVAALVANVALGVVLIPRYGPMGAGLATLGSLLLFALLEYWFVAKSLFAPAASGMFLRSGVACAAMAIVICLLRPYCPLLLVIAAGAVTYSSGLALLGVLSPDEIGALKNVAGFVRMQNGWRPGVLRQRAD